MSRLLHIDVDLDFPIEVAGQTVTKIRFRRMKGRDQMAIEKVKGSNAETGFALMAALAVEPHMAPEDFHEVDAADLKKIDDALRPFIGLPPAK